MRSSAAMAGLSASLYVALTVALTWPLALHPGTTVPSDLGDPLLNTFLIAWNARVVPLTGTWWNLPQFHPIPGVMAYSEHLLGLSLLTSPVVWITGSPLLAHNVAFFLSFVLCALSAHLLCFVLTRRHDVSLLAGVAFGFAPYRMSQFAHVQVLSAYWMPLALAALHLVVQQHRRRWLALFGAAWLLQALTCGYYLFYLSTLVGLWLLWFAVGRERWADIAKIIGVWAVAALGMVPIAYGYLTYSRMYGLKRWPDEIASFSADVASVLTAPANLRLWGWLDVVDRPESQLFPGLAIVVVVLVGLALAWTAAARQTGARLRAPRALLALAAVFALAAASSLAFGPWRLEPFGIRLLSVRTPQKPFSVALLLAAIALGLHPSVRSAWRKRSALAFYALAAVVMWLFALGPSPTLMNDTLLYKAPYSWLMLLPGVDGVRVPARFWVLATLCLAIAGALAVLHIAARWPGAARALPAALAAVVLIEAWPQPLRLERAPDPRPAFTDAAVRLHLPIAPPFDPVALYRAIDHRKPLLNGYSGYFAPHYWAMQHLLQTREPAMLTRLAAFGDLEVVVDRGADYATEFRAYLAAHPGARALHDGPDYAAYRIPAGPAAEGLPELGTDPLPIAAIRASLYQDRVGAMTDGDRITRWDTGGPQDPTNEVTIDLGTVCDLRGIELQIAGFVADFPRVLTIETSVEGAEWAPGWTGQTALMAYSAALERPLDVPLRFALARRPARFIRLRQTGRDDTYYWSIAELRVYGTPASVSSRRTSSRRSGSVQGLSNAAR